MTVRRTIVMLLASAAITGASPVLAHDPESNPGKPKHGGQYVEYQIHYGIEMLAETDKLVFYMTEHLQPRDMTGSNFKVFVQTKTGMKTLPAKPDGTTLVTTLEGVLPSGAKIVLTGKDGDGETLQARFVTK